MREQPRAQVLGLPSAVSLRSAEELISIGTEIFNATIGPWSSLQNDLQRSSVYFDPVAQGQRLRRALAEVPATVERGRLPDEWLVALPSGAVLLTPEGISGVHALMEAVTEQSDGVVVLGPHLAEALVVLHGQYRKWARRRLDSVIGLLEGTAKPLQAQAAGVLVTLLLNDNTSRDRALPRYGESNAEQRKLIDDAFLSAARAFTSAVSPSSLTRSGSGGLISGWPMHEIARRVGAGLVVEPPTEDGPGCVFIDGEFTSRAIDLIARDLQRGNREIPSLDSFTAGIEAVARTLQAVGAQLAGARAFHESPPNTRRIQNRLVEAYARQMELSDGGVA